jgi:hypothetical protein
LTAFFANGINYINGLFVPFISKDIFMTTTKKIPATAAPETPVKQKANPSAPAKLPVSKVRNRKAAVKKSTPKTVTAKAPLFKAFAPAKLEKAIKAKKPKLVRDSFTIPKAEYGALDELKQRAAKLTRPAKKSELLRAGIKILVALSDAAFLTALEQVPTIKTGRPPLKK